MGAPTVYDVAERAHVSIATVSRVYRNPDTVRAGTRDRVLDAAQELGYVPSGNARGLASRSTGVLGLCFPDHADPDAGEPAGPDAGRAGGADAAADADDADADTDTGAMLYSDEVIRGMERAARRHGYALLIAASLAGGPEDLVAKIAGRVDGFAVLAGTVSTGDLEVVSRRLPVVMLAGPREFDHLDHIEADNRAGERELARHLIEDHGHRRLAFVGCASGSPDAQARFRGFRDALRDAELPVPPAPAVCGAMTQAGGRQTARALLERPGERPTAVLFANDRMAVGALCVLERHGVRVPADIAVTGFDGIPLGRLVRPALTTVRQPMRRIGEQAAELLVRRLAERDRDPVSLVLPVSIARRTSCGCPEPGPCG